MHTLTLLNIFGGVFLLLYGMRLVGDGLQKACGARLRGFLLTATANRMRGVFVGAVITALLQSSSATTVMLVGLVGSGLIGLSQTMGVILGADIGTTLTVQIIAFRIYDYALGLVGLGILVRLVSRREEFQHGGTAILGFGFVFFAIKILIDTFDPGGGNSLMADLIAGLGEDLFAGIVISALVTAILHSSAATLGIAISASYSGALSLEAAIPIVLGANIGTCVTAILSSMGSTVDAKRVALAHILFKVAGVVVILPLIGPFTELVRLASDDMPRQIAYAHTFFNIGIAIIFLPITSIFTSAVRYMIPQEREPLRMGPRYLDPLVLTTPSLALGQASREALRVADMVQEMIKDSIIVFKRNDRALCERLQERDNDVDLLDREIKLYLTKLSRESLTEEQAQREFEILAFTNNMENIGDVIDKNLMELALKKIENHLSFSEEGMREIESLHRKVLENFEIGVITFTNSDRELARRLLQRKARVAELERRLRQAHIDRLHRGLKESIDTSAIHLDILTNLKRINSYICNIAYTILGEEKESSA